MTKGRRTLRVVKGTVECVPGEGVTLDRCRFCAHSTRFLARGVWITSPARAYCVRSTAGKDVDLSAVEEVECDDLSGEGYRSITSIIS
ncbi:MAG TPA: hypothetical protein VKO45_02225 [Methanomicrobiales archaeon]|nr:hypothetical protein [Methanomicrobiales archaeon]